MKKNIIKTLTIILMLFMLAIITGFVYAGEINPGDFSGIYTKTCLLYTSDAADEL